MHPDRPIFDDQTEPGAVDASSRDDTLPVRGYVLGMALFLATLTMLLVALMIAYAISRVRLADPAAVPADRMTALPLGEMRPPMLLFLSTAIILASSIAVHYAADALRKNRLAECRKGLVLTLLLAAGFIAVQAPAMWNLLATHRDAETSNFVYGFVFFLVLVHALHVLGGVIPLCVIVARAARNRYDAQHDGPVRCLAYYWHFLDAVWIVMFSLFFVLG